MKNIHEQAEGLAAATGWGWWVDQFDPEDRLCEWCGETCRQPRLITFWGEKRVSPSSITETKGYVYHNRCATAAVMEWMQEKLSD